MALFNGTLGKQKSVSGTLATIAKLASERENFTARVDRDPGVVKLRGKLNWFENLPLFGKKSSSRHTGRGRWVCATAA